MEQEKSIIFGGDFFTADKLVVDDEIERLFKSSNIRLVNLESPILKKEQPEWKHQKSGPNIFQTEKIIEALKRLNISYVGCANNHIFDYGVRGLNSTNQILDKAKIGHGGMGNCEASAQRAYHLDKEIVVISCAEEEFGIASNNKPGVLSLFSVSLGREITKHHERNNFVIVFAHGGNEEVPLPCPSLRRRYRELVGYGADLIVGHHPHIPQGYEVYGGKYIFYSLGNFVHSMTSAKWGMVLRLKVSKFKASKIELFFVLKENGRLRLAGKVEKALFAKYISGCNEVLNSEKQYESTYQEQSLKLYDQYYESYLANLFDANLGLKSKLRSKIGIKPNKNTLGQAVERKQKDRLLLFNLFNNTSHSEAISTSLGVLCGEIEDKRSEISKKRLESLEKVICYE